MAVIRKKGKLTAEDLGIPSPFTMPQTQQEARGLAAEQERIDKQQAFLRKEEPGMGVDIGTGAFVQVPEISGAKEAVFRKRFPGGKLEQIAELEAQKQAIAQEMQARQAIGGLGQLTPEQMERQAITPEGAASKALTAGSVAAGGLAGAKLGAAGGTLIAPIAGTTAGSVVGAAIGAGSVLITKVSMQKRQDVKQAFWVYKTSVSNMGNIITMVNAGVISPGQAQLMWNEELANFYAAERGIKKETATDLKRFLSGGLDEAARVEATKRTLLFMEQQLQIAMLNPNPAAKPTNWMDVEELGNE